MKNELRIIGGIWRSRKLRFPDAPDLRPTSDRVRETLFNWLGQSLEGLNCLDLFAGSGALGFEAASRGARRVVMVDRDSTVCTTLKAHCDLLEARTVQALQMDAQHFLAGTPEPFDVVFLDPPFRQSVLPQTCGLLESRGWLAYGARIYIESPSDGQLDELPHGWQLHRAKQAGAVDYRLYRRD